VRAALVVLGVLACLVYFFFSIEHRGVVGHTARVGTWVLMITFGAAFGYTVMGRIALLVGEPLRVWPEDRGPALELKRLELESRLNHLFRQSQAYYPTQGKNF